MAKRSRDSRPQTTRYTAGEILKLFHARQAPLGWRDVVDAVSADDPRAITQLRKMLNGLLRTGELERDMHGNYRVPGAAQEQAQGTVRREGRTVRVDGYVIPDGMKMSLRDGDVVSYEVEGEVARVSEVLEFSTEPVTGILQWQGRYPYVEAMGAVRGRIALADPADPRHKQVLAGAGHGETVTVRVIERNERGLVGVVEARTEAGSVLDQAIQTAVASLQIPDMWPDAVDAAVKRLPKSVQPGRFRQRRDLTDMPLVTIDGETAKDFDDAVYAEPLRGGRGKGWRLVVAIADVSHYVRPNSALDQEAVERGTSVYFPERVIPMLPEAISNELCSLKPDTPRLALVCDMQIDGKGQVGAHEFYEAVIHSHARLTYTQVAAYLGGKVDALPETHRKPIRASLDALYAVYGALRQARERRGALDFPTHEGALKIVGGRVTGIAPVKRNEATQVIEEAMIAANVCAATFLESHDTPGLYRVHEPPDATRLEELRQALAYAGVRLSKADVTPAVLQQALQSLPETANAWVFGQLALRSMQQAIYTPDNRGHFGLALERYMHFTSPIRRYPDLMVHRAIKSVIYAQEKDSKSIRLPDSDGWQWLGETCSSTERRAESASWMVDGWLKCDYLSEHIGETFNGTVAAVMEFGLFVEIEGFYVQGLLHVSNLGSDYFTFNARAQNLVGERSGKHFSMGDVLQVVVQAVEPSQGKVDLALAGGRSRASKASGSAGGNKSRGRKRRG